MQKKNLLLALGLVATLGANAQTSPYAGVEVQAGDFYLYNVETGYWLMNNNRQTVDWNSHAELDPVGYDFGLIANGDGWQIDPKMGNNHSLNASNLYMDTGDGVTVWTFEPKEVSGVTNAYTIKCGDVVLGANNDKFLQKTTENSTWQVISAEERLNVMASQYATASGTNPIDFSWMIPGGQFNIVDEHANVLNKFIGEGTGAVYASGQTQGNGVREIWNNPNGFDIGYTLTGLPNGIYRFTVSGYYRNGAVEAIGSKHRNGEEDLLALIYANDKTQPLMSIVAPERTSAGNGCNKETNGYYVPDNIGDASIATRDGLYVNKALKVVVEDGVLSIGVKKDGGVQWDWTIFDYFDLKYYGPNNIDQYIALLQNAISEAEAFDASTTSTAMANALADAIATAKSMLTSDDSDEIEAATTALEDALAAAKTVNVSMLRQIIALAESESVNADAAKQVLADATTATEVNQAVNDLNIQRRLRNLQQPDIFTGTAPTDGGEYYLFNVGTRTFLGNGSDWCTHAAVVYDGLLVTLHAADGKFTITDAYGSFNNSPYVDTPGNTPYAFEAVSGKENIYNILEGTDLLGWNPDGKTDGNKYWSSISNTPGADASDPIYQWKLVTRQERIDLLNGATADNPVDASFYIKGGDLNRMADGSWKKETTGGNGGPRVNIGDTGDGNRQSNYAYEFFECERIRFTQDLTDLPRGNYRVSVQGFYRERDGGGQAEIVNNGGELRSNGYLMANNEKQFLPNIATVTDVAPGIASLQASNAGYFPNMPSSAIKFMEYGYYKTEVDVTVGRDGKLTIGLGLDERISLGDWIVIDNFRLAYLGSDVDINALIANLQKAIEAAEAFDGQTTDAVAAALAAAIEEGKSYLTSTDVDAIEDAIVLVNDALAKAQAVNTEVLVATVNLAEGEGINVNEANDVLANATEQADVDQTLFNLRADRKLKAQSLKDIYTGSAPAAGKVYLFNVGTGLFLGTGSDWNTHAAVDQVGIEVELVDLDEPEENNFKIKTERGGGWLNWAAYVDTPNEDVWHFVPVEGKAGVYNISSSGNDGNLLGYDPNGPTDGQKYWSTIAKDRTGVDNPMNQWKVITPAEREALIEKANAVTPIDVSYLIKNASLNRQDGYDMWVKNVDGGNGGARVSTVTDNNGDRAENFAWEYWNTSSFSFMQTIEGLKPGVYEVSVNAFYRDGNGSYQAGVVNEGGELLQTAYLVANDVKEPLANIASAMSVVPGAGRMQGCDKGEFPNYPESAIEYFETGYYKNTVEVLVGEDGMLTLGVAKDEQPTAEDWVVLDNFRLVYKGQPTAAPAIPTTWNVSDDAWVAGEYAESFMVNGLTVVTTGENGRTVVIDQSNATVGDQTYTKRLRLGSTGSATNRHLTFLAPGSFNIEVVMASNGSSVERPLNVAVGDFQNVVATMTTKGDVATLQMASVMAELEQPVYLYSGNGGINIYAIYLKAYDETVTGIADLSTDARRGGDVYNLQGQKVSADRKGLYIVGGNKIIVK